MSISDQFDHTLYTRHLHILDHIINFLKIVLLQTVSQVMITFFSNFFENQGETESVTEKNIFDRKEMSKDTSGTRKKIKLALGEDFINMHSTALNETPLVFEIESTINKETFIIAPGQGKIPVSILNNKFCDKFPHLFPKDKFDFIIPRNIPISPAWYFKKGYLILFITLHQIQIIIFLRGLFMNSNSYIHQ